MYYFKMFQSSFIKVPIRIMPQYADKQRKIPTFNLFFFISEGKFFI